VLDEGGADGLERLIGSERRAHVLAGEERYAHGARLWQPP
jgi:hypothetical protein